VATWSLRRPVRVVGERPDRDLSGPPVEAIGESTCDRRGAPGAGGRTCVWGLGSSPLGQAGAGGHEITEAKRPFVACGRMGEESMNRHGARIAFNGTVYMTFSSYGN